jgi:hypothetical protein
MKTDSTLSHGIKSDYAMELSKKHQHSTTTNNKNIALWLGSSHLGRSRMLRLFYKPRQLLKKKDEASETDPNESYRAIEQCFCCLWLLSVDAFLRVPSHNPI